MQVALDTCAPLRRSLQTVLNVVPTRTPLPVLSNVLLSADAEQLTLHATDLETAITATLPARVEEPGALAIPARKLAQVIRELPDDPVALTTDGLKFILQYGTNHCQLMGVAQEEFPTPPSIEAATQFQLDGELLGRLIRKTLFAVAVNHSTPALNGVLWRITPEQLTMVATDGGRLAKINLTHSTAGTLSVDAILPPKALNSLVRLVGEHDGPLGVALSENYAQFDLGPVILFSRLIEGPFPEFERFIPQQNDRVLRVDRTLFTAAVRRAAVLTDTQTQLLRLSLRNDQVQLFAASPDLGGQLQEALPASYGHEDLEVGYNYRFLLDALEQFDSEEVVMQMNGALSPALLTPGQPTSGEDYLCLIMPMRLG